MPLYEYRCPTCETLLEVFHSIAALGALRTCPTCGTALRRHFTPVHHWWPAQYRPGFEDSGQRLVLDPEFQARTKDDLAARKEAHGKATAHERQEGAHGHRGE